MRRWKNAQQAYLVGLADGRKQGLRDMFTTHAYVLLPAMYNAKDDDIITDKYFAKYAKDTEIELQRIIDECFDGDICTITAIQNTPKERLSDKVQYLMEKVNQIRDICNDMERI